jgi:hypothetical protein
MTQNLEHTAFLENLESKFRLYLDGSEQAELELVDVSERKVAQRQEIFSIEFRSRSSAVLPQRIYRLDHDKLGQFDLFLVPIRKNDQGVYYEAVFNRTLKDSASSGSAS